MNILLAFDKFKDCLTATEACTIAREVLEKKYPEATFVEAPLTDGGEGFSSILTEFLGGEMVEAPCLDPLGREITAQYGWLPGSCIPSAMMEQFALERDRPIALIEMAQASGLELLGAEERDVWKTSTFGTGQLINDAIKKGAQVIFLGLGGSATNDMGCGALSALGVSFATRAGRVDCPSPDLWAELAEISFPAHRSMPRLFAICDVDNPLLGERGCSAVYGPQKGLLPEDLPRMESMLEEMSLKLSHAAGTDLSLRNLPGTGAAGGIAYGLSHLFLTDYTSGFSLVEELLDLEKKVQAADIVITGEGKFDESSLEGKGPGTLVQRVSKAGDKTIYVFAGKLELPDAYQNPFAKFHQISLAENSLTQNLQQGKALLAEKIREVFSS